MPLLDAIDAGTLIQCPRVIAPNVEELLKTGVTIIRQSLPAALCDEIRNGFIDFAAKNSNIFRMYQDEYGHYPRIINLHLIYKPLFELFRRNVTALMIQDYLFESETVLYTSLFYERGQARQYIEIHLISRRDLSIDTWACGWRSRIPTLRMVR